MKQFKAQAVYFGLYQLHCEKYDRGLKVISAVSSSASISAWVIWRTLSWVWGAIIAASQVLTAIKPYLPFEQRRKAAGELSSKYDGLFLQFESTWQKVAAGQLSDAQINEKITKLKLLAAQAVQHSVKSPLPDKQQLIQQAAVIARQYFIAIYTTP